MLLNKMLKLFTTLLLLLFTVSLISFDEKTIRTNIEIENNNETNFKIYLLDKNNKLVKYKIYLDQKDIKESIEEIIEYLKTDNDLIPINLNGYINKNINIERIELEKHNLKISFSNNLLDTNIDENIIVTGLAHSLLELENINSIEILVNNKYIKNYEYKITKEIGINNNYLISNLKDVNKVVINYIEKIDNENYIVPITKYINNKEDKVDIIIDELKINTNDYISGINNELNVLGYREEENMMIINFNDKLLSKNEENNKLNMEIISESIFDNFDVNYLMIEQEGEKITQIARK